jgi:type IV pilus assembly protein PilN
MIKINLVPLDGLPKAAGGRTRSFSLPALPEFNLGMLFGIVYLVAIIALGGWWWQVSAHEIEVATMLKQSNEELASLKQRVGQASTVKDRVAELKKRIDAIQELTKNQTRPVVLFDAMADVIPRDLWLTSLEERGNTLRISGMSFSTTAVADFMANLRASGKFKDVDIVQSRQDINKTPRMVDFQVTCRFES